MDASLSTSALLCNALTPGQAQDAWTHYITSDGQFDASPGGLSCTNDFYGGTTGGYCQRTVPKHMRAQFGLHDNPDLLAEGLDVVGTTHHRKVCKQANRSR